MSLLPPVPDEFVRLYRVDNTRRSQRPVEGLSGRWFSDDPAYIDTYYGRPNTWWTYVDVPRDVAEASRYERVVETPAGRNLFGWEGKDFILPAEWAARRTRCERPADEIHRARVRFCESRGGGEASRSLRPLPITEITSNVARPGFVLRYDAATGYAAVVERVGSRPANADAEEPADRRDDQPRSPSGPAQRRYATILIKQRGLSHGQYLHQLVPIREVVPLTKYST